MFNTCLGTLMFFFFAYNYKVLVLGVLGVHWRIILKCIFETDSLSLDCIRELR